MVLSRMSTAFVNIAFKTFKILIARFSMEESGYADDIKITCYETI